MRVVVVGNGDAFESGGRFQICIALSSGGPPGSVHTLLDCGATSLVALHQTSVDLSPLSKALLGSVSQRLLLESPVPVLAVKPED